MGSLERQLKKLEDGAGLRRLELRCPECGWETTVHGDPALGLIVLDYDPEPAGIDPATVELFKHEHDAWSFIEKRSGLPLEDPAVSGIGQSLATPETREDGR